MTRTRFAVAIAVVCVACVNVPDSIKGTFASRQNGETDNFSASAPHSVAPPDPVLTQATISIADASTDARLDDARLDDVRLKSDWMCHDSTASSSSDASMSSPVSNCLQDAGNP